MPSTIMAKWGKKKWRISSKKLNPIGEISYTMPYDSDADEKGKRSVKVPYTVYKEFGVDVDTEINDWYRLLGSINGLYIGKKRFGPAKLKLTDVSVASIHVSDGGVVRSASFSLSFTEP